MTMKAIDNANAALQRAQKAYEDAGRELKFAELVQSTLPIPPGNSLAHPLPVDPPAKRTEPDYLTAGFMAIGAETEFKRQTAKGAHFSLQGGYLGFIGDVLQHGLLLDKVADHIDKHGEHPGCWCYEVAEAFGGKFAEQVLLGCDSAESAKILLREIMVEAGYDQTLLAAMPDEDNPDAGLLPGNV